MDGALPFGMLMFVGMFAAVVYRRVQRRRAANAFPELAATLGLAYSPPRYAGGVGGLSGVVRGYRVVVDPDEQRMIAVRFDGAPRVELKTYPGSYKAPYDMVTVHSGDRAFDEFFKTRHASEEIADRIAESDSPGRLVSPFQGRYYRQVQSIAVTSQGVICRLDFGSPPHIPAAALERLLPACVALAELVEPSSSVMHVSHE